VKLSNKSAAFETDETGKLNLWN